MKPEPFVPLKIKNQQYRIATNDHKVSFVEPRNSTGKKKKDLVLFLDAIYCENNVISL